MPAHWCIYKFMFYIYLIKYLFNISEYKAMIIKLLIYHTNIDVCIYNVYIYIYIYVYIMYIYIYVCVYVCMHVYIYIYIYIYIYVCVLELGCMTKNLYHGIFLNYTGFTVYDGIYFFHA